jgi:hypothetical protein
VTGGSAAGLTVGRPAGVRGAGVYVVGTLLLVGIAVLVERGAGAAGLHDTLSDLLQFGLAFGAAGTCARAAVRGTGPERAFWALLGVFAATWGAGAALWALHEVGLAGEPALVVQDALFVGAAGPLLAALLVRPDERRGTSLALLLDGALLVVLFLHAWLYFALSHELAGDPAGYAPSFDVVLDLRVLVVLVWLWHVVRSATPPWRGVYQQIGVALVLFYGGGAISNRAFDSGRYHAGLYDLPWLLPFFWIAVLAHEWAGPAHRAPASSGADVDWRDARRGVAVALIAVVFVPSLHFVVQQIHGRLDGLMLVRARLTFVTTVVVGALFLFRQLRLFRASEATLTQRRAELRRAEDALRETEERFHLAIGGTGAVLYRLNFASMTYDYMTPNVLALTGYPLEEINARGFKSLVVSITGPFSTEEAFREMARKREHGVVEEYWADYRIRTRSGELRWLADHSLPWHGPDGKARGTVGVLLDITERKQMEEALRVSEERYRLLFERSPYPMFVYDAGTQAILEANDAALTHYGYAREEVSELKVADLWAEGEPGAVAPEQGGWRSGRHRRKDRTILEVELTSHGLVVEGRMVRLALIVDVTERRRLEAQLLHAQKMEAVGRLAGGIAHDFNNLLTAILGYTSLLETPPDEASQTNLQEIERAAERATSLTRQLLAFSRKQILVPEVLDLGGLVRDTARMLERLIGEDVELTTLVGRDAGAVRADPGQLEQVIVNLVVNARDAMPQGGAVTIEVKGETLDDGGRAALGLAPGPYVVLRVTDTGIGMDAATRGRIFEPFFTTKEKGKGTGLGLAMVYGIVTQSGGAIAVESAPGRGATFRVYLPRVAESPRAAGDEVDRRQPTGGSETVLLVEDDAAVRRLARQILERGGYTVIECAGSEEGLKASEEHGAEIHLLLADIVMPGINGRELAGHLRRSRPGMRILYMSGYAADVVADHGVLGTGTGLIEKPFTADMLLRKVRAALDA